MDEKTLKNINLKEMHELIDLYKYASIEGERVEFIVYPTKDNKRIITIGLQNGFARDKDTFIFDDGDKFDSEVYPELLSYFTCDDSLGNWDVLDPELSDVTIKGTNETKSGNIVYLDTYNKELYNKLNEEVESVKEKETYKKDELTNIDKVWDEIIFYAKERRQLLDFYKGSGFTKEELDVIYDFVFNIEEKIKGINYGKTRKTKTNNENILKELFNNKEEVLNYGLNEELYSKIVNTSMVKKLAHLAGIEKRIRNRLDLSEEEIKNKVNFATSELDKVEFFNLKNASVHEFEKKEFIESKPKAINELIDILDNSDLYYEEIKEQYKEYCYEILDYLEKKSINGKKIVDEKDNSDILFTEYEEVPIDKFDEFEDAISLIRGAKLDSEKYEIIVDRQDDLIKVRIDLLDGPTRQDIYEFEFINKELFDEKIKEILNEIYEEDPILKEKIVCVDLPGKELMKTSLTKTEDGNEILLRNQPLELPKEEKPIVVEGKKKEEHVQIEQPVIKEEIKIEEPVEAKQPVIEKEKKTDSKLEKLKGLEKQFSDYLFEQEKEKEQPKIETKEEKIVNKIEKEVKKMEEERFDFSIDSSLFNDIDLATFDLIMDKYKCYPIDALYKKNITKEEKQTIIKVLVKQSELINYYNSNYSKINKMDKASLAKLAKCETLLMTIFRIMPSELDDIDRIKSLISIEEITPYGMLLLKNLQKEEKMDIKTDYIENVFEFNINRYAELLEKYSGNISTVSEEESKKDREDLTKLMNFKMELIEGYNNLLLTNKTFTKEEATKLAKYETRLSKILEIDAKYAPEREEMIQELKDNYDSLVPFSKLMLKTLIKSKEKDTGLFEIVEKPKEEKEDEVITEIKDAYEKSLTYATMDTPSLVEVVFDQNNKKEADVIISNKVNNQPVVIYQRTMDIDKLNNSVMDVIRKLYANNNEIKYPIKFNVGGTSDYCLLLIGENRRTFKITNATEEFVDENKKKTEEEFEEIKKKIK